LSSSAPEKIEAFLRHPLTRAALRPLTHKNGRGECPIDRVMNRFDDPSATLHDRVTLGLVFALIDRLCRWSGASPETVRDEVFRHVARHRGIVNTLRGIARYGLVKPQIFSAPLMVVWNFTQACNFKCQHCYQNAAKALPDELTLDEQIRIVDELVDNDVPLIAFSGGEPMMGKNFWPVVEYCGAKDLNIQIATNGSLLTPEAVDRLARANVRYVEVSVDSVDPERHDAFRGVEGYWRRTIDGIKNVIADGRMKCGLASTITRNNIGELDDLVELAKSLGCDTFYAFNFIPTGRGKGIVDIDLTPRQRESMLRTLHKHLWQGEINIVTSAPQLGRACLEFDSPNDIMNTGHYGAGQGERARMLARYVGGCGAGRAYCALQPNGVVTPCVFMPIEVGDLRRQSLPEIWHGSEVLKRLRTRENLKGACAGCDYKLYCGGCRARAWGYFDDLDQADPGCLRNEPAWQAIAGGAPLPQRKTPGACNYSPA
jgi:radical SAM protein with 4Fe4S-binding SPASM domain